MATNLVSAVMQFLTPDMIAKIASALGIDRSIAQKAIGGAVPALLSALTGRGLHAERRAPAQQRRNAAAIRLSRKPERPFERFERLPR